ncbi:hydroxyethylthiazole kinase [Sphingobacterium phlebotomi]|uniref:Hydroxyethylthiazole kinase n=1 Tax=Sphingobacterium phlebotomi TaxID=2605433 RepID=A0A5D4GV67_9SPHI|nr:hydroxyethylthiazole kinase [Sphingobacterium phlebotomi]TYR31803.1 hydroxyethylthiazole kinase [Sphingobacterium phlebotomi]
MEKTCWKHIQTVREQSPLVHNITNYVVMNNTANALLAIGASPVMAHAKAEVKDMTTIADVLLINIGTLDEYWSEAMLIAAKTANALRKPWVLDPVGAGATPYRNQILQKLLQYRPTVIRGNASEILAIAKSNASATKGVDSTASSMDAVQAARNLVNQYGSVVCISGETDIIVDQKNQTLLVKNGHPMMTKVTGLGCTASALTAAFVALVEDKTEATVTAMALLGIAGELSEKQSSGPGTLQMNIIDKLYAITEMEFAEQLNVSRE